MARQILGGEDAAWLHMDAPTNPMVVNALVELEQRLPRERAEALVMRLSALPRFGSRIVERMLPGGPPAWEDFPGFRPLEHLAWIELDVPNDAALRDAVGEIVSVPLDMHRPLWSVHVIDRPAAGTTLLFRVHHALADGFALLGVLASMCDGGPGSIDVAAHRARGLAADAIRGSVKALGHLVASPADPPTALKHRPGTRKQVAWTEPIALSDVKAAARASSATVNDVLVSLVAGALARYLERGERGDLADVEVHAMVPVNLRPEGATASLGNEFGLVILGLPLGIRDPLARVHAVKERMEKIKGTPEAGVAHDLLRVLGWTPRKVEDLAVGFFAAKTSLVLTNVPGPRRAVSLAGARVQRMMFWVPQASRMGLGISIFSYAGAVTVGVIADTEVVAEPDRLVADVQAELDALDACLRTQHAQRTG